MHAGSWVAVVAAPLVLLGLLLARPAIDLDWENQQAHFWLVLGAAALATALGWAVSVAARRRRDARLFLISLAFIASSGFLGLHALATPSVLLGPNAGFELATPAGLVVAGLFAAASSLELSPARAQAVVGSARFLL
nr:adenylate/guanylate cyclase domain-containing protein [Actinomycetota bacterium]